MNRYGVALLLFSAAILPLAYLSIWLSLAAGIVVYALLARLARKDLERKSQLRRTIRRPGAILTKR
jgi:hypothetical protein